MKGMCQMYKKYFPIIPIFPQACKHTNNINIRYYTIKNPSNVHRSYAAKRGKQGTKREEGELALTSVV